MSAARTSYETLLVEVDRGVALVTLNRPARLNALDRQMTGDLFDALWAFEADDAVQEAFTKVFRSVAGFRGESSLSTWIKRIVINEALQKLRCHARRAETSLDGLLPAFDDTGHRIAPAKARSRDGRGHARSAFLAASRR